MKTYDKLLILAKIEPVYGTDSVPTEAANAIMAKQVRPRPLQGQRLSRDLHKPFLGSQGAVMVGKHGALSYRVEMAPSGTAGTAPAWGPLVRACGLAETLVAVTSAAYDPVSSGFEAVSQYYFADGILHKYLGSRGNLQLELTGNGFADLVFDFNGLYVAPTDVALPTPDFSAFQNPQEVSDDNTPTFTIGGTDLVMARCNFNFGNRVDPRFLVNSSEVPLTDRGLTGTAVVDQTAIGTFNPFDLATARTRVPLQIVHGVGAGNIATIDCPTIEIDTVEPGEDSQGVATWSLGFTAVPSDAGDDEFKLTLT